MIESGNSGLELEQRREALRVGRRGIGHRLEVVLEGVVRAPVPSSWLELLRDADERAALLRGRRSPWAG